MTTIINLLDNEIVRRLNGLTELEDGSKEMGAAIEDIEHLFKMRMEERKQDSEDQARESEKLENICREKERSKRFKLDVAGLGVPILFYGIWMILGFKFEETGSITSKTFMNFINKLKPTK